MKRIFLLSLALCATLVTSAEEYAKAGIYDVAEGRLVKATAAPTVIAVTLDIETQSFTPGIYARYAQKYLGRRASLAARSEMAIVGASILDSAPAAAPRAESQVDVVETLAPNRFDGRAMTLEEQASATAELIFSLRKHRLDLITGEAGENVFGAGLRAALDEIAALEKEYLAMFYGTSNRSVEHHTFAVEVKEGETDYTICRYREGEGVVPLDNLAGEAVVLHIETPSDMPAVFESPQPKDKVAPREYLVLHDSKCRLSCGVTTLAEAVMPLLPYAKRVVARPLK